ncbi:suppressor protein SRP40-like [Fundulus heteroclitus]|uniref:suppressor protein SRP40-like n=1 Tax=Fundulus heteroclitus TaxID=8078 RepID=UPI00165C23AD|nr:suppressor protein SRP40-like [Fundulus heteroclitus]
MIRERLNPTTDLVFFTENHTKIQKLLTYMQFAWSDMDLPGNPTFTDFRTSIATYARNILSPNARQKIAHTMCHNTSTADKYYALHLTASQLARIREDFELAIKPVQALSPLKEEKLELTLSESSSDTSVESAKGKKPHMEEVSSSSTSESSSSGTTTSGSEQSGSSSTQSSGSTSEESGSSPSQSSGSTSPESGSPPSQTQAPSSEESGPPASQTQAPSSQESGPPASQTQAPSSQESGPPASQTQAPTTEESGSPPSQTQAASSKESGPPASQTQAPPSQESGSSLSQSQAPPEASSSQDDQVKKRKRSVSPLLRYSLRQRKLRTTPQRRMLRVRKAHNK